MVNVVVTTPPAAFLTAADLRAHLRLNDTGEDAQLTDFLAAAVERFEADTLRPILSTSYRQYLTRWPVLLDHSTPHEQRYPAQSSVWPISGHWPFKIVLGRGGVTAVTAVKQYLADGSTQTLAASTDLLTNPARVNFLAPPAYLLDSNGIPLSTVGYVDFTAGWANGAAVPKSIAVAVKMLAGHWYQNREAYAAGDLGPVAQGWERIKNNFRLGLSGDWGQ